MSAYSDRILFLIEQRGISYADLARATGISKSALQRYATGKTEKIPLDCVEKIANALDASQEFIMGWNVEAAKTDTPAGLDERFKMFSALSPEAQERVLEYMRFEVQKQSQ